MKKKITALLLALLFVGSLASCGGSGKTNEDNSAVGDASTGELEINSIEPEDENTPAESNDDEVVFDADTALAYFETSEGREWLYQYLFGAEGEGTTEDTTEETTEAPDEEETESENISDTSDFDSLSADEKAQKIIDYLNLDSVDLLTKIENPAAITIETAKTPVTLDECADFGGNTESQIVEQLKIKFASEGYSSACWVELYEKVFTDDQKTEFRAWYNAINASSEESGTEDDDTGADDTDDNSGESETPTDDETTTDTEDEGGEGEEETVSGYDDWLSAKLQEEENAEDRSKVWKDLTSPELLEEYLEEYLATEEGQDFLRSDAVQQLLTDYYTENEEAMEELAVSTGYRAKMVKKSFITLAIVVVVLLAVFAGALLLLLSRADKQEKKLRRKLKAAEDQLNAVPTRPAGGMDLALKQKLTASPVRETPAAPVAPVAPPNPPVVKTPSKPIEPEKPVTPPVVPAAPIVTGYYSLAEEAVEAARYHLSPKFSVRKVSEEPLNPPTPYVGYSDHTLDLNRDYYAKAGGNKANNARAWDYLMGATVQITECFSIVSQDGIPITDVSSATGKQIVSVERAKIGADGSITARGTITLA